MKDYIQKLHQKPEHVRRRIALGTSVGVTALIAVLWFGTMAASGAFALGPADGSSNLASGDEPASAVALTSTNVKSNFSQLLGAVSAATGGTTTKPALTIVNTESSSTIQTTQTTPSGNGGSATVIPF